MAVASLFALGATLGFQAVHAAPFESQVNISMCNWNKFRANIIRDTVYLDGGELYWRRGLSDGSYDSPQNDGNNEGLIYSLQLGQAFDTSKDNLTALFKSMQKAAGAANNIAPNMDDGVMFANDYKFYLYGGLLAPTDSVQDTDLRDDVLEWERYQYGPPKPSWSQGFVGGFTNNDVHTYVSHGAGVSAPSEKLGFYFSGMRGEDWGEITALEAPPHQTSNRLITVDMEEIRAPEWSNTTLDDVPGRALGELVWVPVSEKGVLVAIGGIKYPEDLFSRGANITDDQAEENESTGPEFMKSIPVYDVASGSWYMQNTTGDTPPTLARFCSVVAEAKDKSSYNIYIYGGYDGQDASARPSDAVYVLSVPTFRWVKVYDGESNHGRYGHKCFRTYPDKMLVLGGLYTSARQCVPGGFIQVFNLNTLKFQDVYDPQDWEEYKVPDLISAQIGGNSLGGADDEPEDEWDHDDLEELFDTEYTGKIETYYPYEAPEVTASPTPGPEDESSEGGGGGLPKWVPPVLGVVLGLVAISAAAVVWLVWRRRRNPQYVQSVTGTSETRNRILGWMYGVGQPQVPPKPDPTLASTELGVDHKHTSRFSEAGFESVASPHPTGTVVYSDAGTSGAQEAGSQAVYEMHSEPRSAPIELPTEHNFGPAAGLAATAAAKGDRTPSPHTQARHLSDASTTFISPVSPPVSPPPDHPSQQPLDDQQRPGHNRGNSSISSAGVGGIGFPASLDDAIAADQRRSQGQRHVSTAFTEEGLSPMTERPDPMDQGRGQGDRT